MRSTAPIADLISEWNGRDAIPCGKGQDAVDAEETVRRICDVLCRGSRFLLTAHLAPDGDSLGSALALAHALWGMGKVAHIRNRDPMPRRYAYLPGARAVDVCEDLPACVTDGNGGGEPYDALFTFECPDVGRTGFADIGRRFFVVNIDHHQDNACFGALNWVDPAAPAVGEMIHRLLGRLGLPVTPEVATCIYTALVTDTGSFTYSNTTAGCLALGAEMVERGASPHRIALSVYDCNRYEKMKLLGSTLARMERDGSGRIAWLHVTLEELGRFDALPEETDDFVNYPRSIARVDVAIIFKEIGRGRYKVSLRGKNDVDVFSVARSFGGGGHQSASGCSIEGHFDHVRDLVLARVAEAIAARDRGR